LKSVFHISKVSELFCFSSHRLQEKMKLCIIKIGKKRTERREDMAELEIKTEKREINL